jgi:hexosaminidase
MKRLLTLLVAGMLISPLLPAQVHVIPQPVDVKTGEGFFRLAPNTGVSYPSNNAEAKKIAEGLAQKLSLVTGFNIPTRAGVMNTGTSNITLVLNASPNVTLGSEGYQLKVTPTITTITANAPAGLFYGIQTLMQLLPAEAEGGKKVDNLEWKVPVAEITDYPRFGWRGLMLDVSRHFFTKDEVKRFIDDMVKYKFNVLHWHLTDDQGWRIEIKSLPKLTEVGAWNVKKVGRFGAFSNPDSTEPRNYGGFYTQADIKEVVQYAKERYVNILPEVDVPGHSMAAIAAYPELVSTPGKYYVNSGEKFMEWPSQWSFLWFDRQFT